MSVALARRENCASCVSHTCASPRLSLKTEMIRGATAFLHSPYHLEGILQTEPKRYAQGVRSLFVTIADLFRRKISSDAVPPLSPQGPSLIGPIAIVGLVVNREDRQLLDGVCKGNRWHLLFVDTCEEAWSALERLKAPVILYDRDLPGKGWRETVEELAASPSRACVILVSAVLDTYLRDEVVRNGGYDVLCKPLREADVVRVVRLASLYWRSRPAAMSDLIEES